VPDAPREDAPVVVRLEGVHKSYRGSVAVEHVDLSVRSGEFFTMLGPSGSGKTTSLRLIAGFERPDRGRIELNGVDVTGLPPYDRDVNTVFQDYALFPHMSIAENVAYGLQAKGVRRSEQAGRVAEALRMVRLEAFRERRPGQLSGGQRQRVALARAIVNHPQVLLLDEPLGALDLRLRQEMQVELKRIQREVNITFLYVTHDQEEALTMSDRVAVFNHGRIEQIGTPADIYERPTNEFVAGFIGASNILDRGGRRVLVRPEKIHIASLDPASGAEGPAGAARGTHAEHGILREVVYVGMYTRYLVELGDGTAIVSVQQNHSDYSTEIHERAGERVIVTWRSEAEVPL
jgi:putative spermidine/putrescine transport system ATP-binding protein